MSRPTYVEIDLEALQYNLTRIRKLAPTAKVTAMIKANAYGHGLSRVAQALIEADAFGVAGLEEASAVRRAGLQNPIILMAGFFSSQEFEVIEALQCELVIHCKEQITVLQQRSFKKPIKIWIKINTGMNRLGFRPEEVGAVYEALSHLAFLQKPFGFMTHFSDADCSENHKTEHQIELFETATVGFLGERSLANSAGILNFPQAHADWVRPGLLLYGASPIAGKLGRDFNLKPVMTLRSQLIAKREQNPQETVGYGSTWQCKKITPVGIAAIGYGDGYPYRFKTETPIPVLVGGQLCSVLGRVAMDMVAIDLSANPYAQVGDEVILWGSQLPVELVAKAAGTIPYKLLCGIAPRVHGAE